MSGFKRDDTNFNPSTAIVRQDSRTTVHTTRAENATTNTTVSHSAGFDYNKSTLTLTQTRETVECYQQAYVTVKTSRRTPTQEELAELMQLMKTQDSASGKRRSGNFTPNSGNRFSASSANATSNTIDALSLRSTPKFKSHRNSGNSFKNFQYSPSSPGGATGSRYTSQTPTTPKTPTLVKIENSSLTQSEGRKVTTHSEQQRVKARDLFFQQSPTTTTTQITKDHSIIPFKEFNSSLLKSSPATNTTNASGVYTFPKPNTNFTTTITSRSITGPTPTYPSISTPSKITSNNTYSSGLYKSGISRTTPNTGNTEITPKFATSSMSRMTAENNSATSNGTSYVSPYSKLEIAFKSSTPTSTNTISAVTTTTPKLSTTKTVPTKSTTVSTPSASTYLSALLSQSKAKSESDGKCLSPPKIPEVTPATKKATDTKKLKPGIAFIINNYRFDDKTLETREGTNVDVENLKKIFKKFKMECNIYVDPKKEKIQSIGEKLRLRNFKDSACVVVAVLSHGRRHDWAAARDEEYCIDDELVFPMFQNKTLIDKHKILFLQLCKGDREVSKLHIDSKLVSLPKKNFAPNELLKCYSTFEGFVSYRQPTGTYFIEALCELLEKNGMTKDIRDIINDVIITVKERSENRQVPSMTTTFTTPFIFGDYVK